MFDILTKHIVGMEVGSFIKFSEGGGNLPDLDDILVYMKKATVLLTIKENVMSELIRLCWFICISLFTLGLSCHLPG